MQTTRIVIADDQEPVRQGLKTLFELEDDLVVVGEAANGLEASHLVDETLPDVVVLDLEMPVLGGLQAAHKIKTDHPEIRIVMITIHPISRYQQTAETAGVDVLLEKGVPTKILLAAVRGTARPILR